MRGPLQAAAGTACAALVAAVLPAQAGKQPYSRYQTIVDRQMFGSLPPGFDPTRPPSEVSKSSQKELTKEQEQLKSAIRFSVINMTPDGQVAVGFTDSSDGKNPRHYYLKVGESCGDWLVKAADPEAATMTVAKGDLVVTLPIGGDSAKDAAATAKAGAGAPAPGGAARRSSVLATLGARRLARAAEAQRQEDARRQEREEQRRRQEEERQAREADREEQRSQLLAIQSELKAIRERKQSEQAGEKEPSEHERDDAE